MNSLSNQWLEWIGAMSWQLAALISLIAVATVLARRASARLRYALWSLVLLKLFIPPTLSAPWSPAIWSMPRLTTAAQSGAPVEKAATEALSDEAGAAFSSEPLAASPTVPATLTPPATAQLTSNDDPPVPELNAPVIALVVWAGGVIIYMLFVAIPYVRLRRRLRVAEVIDEGNLSVSLERLCLRMGIAKSPRLVLSPELSGPFLYGALHPTIVIPASLACELNPDEIENVFMHELVHLKRRDIPVGWLQVLAQALFWFHPLVWFANSRMREERERACDETVLSTGHAQPRSYAESLLRSLLASRGRSLVMPGFLGIFERHTRLQRRLEDIMNENISTRKMGFMGWSIVALFALVVMPMSGARKAEAQETATSGTTETSETQGTLSNDSLLDENQQLYVEWTIGQFGPDPEPSRFAGMPDEEKKSMEDRWITVLQGPENAEHQGAINGLAAMRSKRAIQPLLFVAMEDREKNNRSRWMAVRALSLLEDKSVVPRLIHLVYHGNQNTRLWAQIALVRLTGQNFGYDWQKWGEWWNAQGGQPPFDPTVIEWIKKPEDKKYGDPELQKQTDREFFGKMKTRQTGQPDTASSSSATPTMKPLPTLDELPGKLTFHGRYRHRSRGQDIESPAEVWIKESDDGSLNVLARVPFSRAMELASAQSNRLTSYRMRFEKTGDGPEYFHDFAFADGKVKLTNRNAKESNDGKEFKVPTGALYDPNSRPDSYLVSNILLRGLALREGETKELAVYDWDNRGENFADYTIEIKHAGKEQVEVPAGKFEANHLVLTQKTSADTWFKKRAGHLTDFWVLDNNVIVRILRHREPYEVMLLDYSIPEQLIGGVGEAAPVTKSTGKASVNSVVVSKGMDKSAATQLQRALQKDGYGPVEIHSAGDKFDIRIPVPGELKQAQALLTDLKSNGYSPEGVNEAGSPLPAGTTEQLSSEELKLASDVVRLRQKVESGAATAKEIDELRNEIRSLSRDMKDVIAAVQKAPESPNTERADLAGSHPAPPPRIVATSPEIGAKAVDPNTSLITVTFDRDMSTGMSWTGGGPEFPPAPDGKQANWVDARTCALPVSLKEASYYRVGINSTSYQNFKSREGIPADPTAVYFTTKGAGDELTAKVKAPRIVEMIPGNGSTSVDPALRELRVTFDMPMGGGFSWTGGGVDYPRQPEGASASWSEDKKTCILPVQLEPNHEYRLGLNSISYKNFQSEAGVPLEPVIYTFRTRE